MDFGSLPVSVVRLIDRVCDEFESAWRAGGRPLIEDHLRGASGPGRSPLLLALLASEIESRRQLGERPDCDEYLARFPSDVELVHAAFPAECSSTVERPVPAAHSAGNWPHSRALSRAPVQTGGFFGKRLWAWPLVAAGVFTVAGYWVRAAIERVMRGQVVSELLALREANVEALRLLFGAHQAAASIAAHDQRVRASVRDLLASRERDAAALLRSPNQAELRAVLGPWLAQYEYDGFCILDRRGYCIGSWRDLTVGGAAGREEVECLVAVFEGRSTVSRPRPAEVPLLDIDGEERLGVPTMFVLAPIRGEDGQVVAALGFRMRPERTLTRVLSVARFGGTGETYAFDRAGVLLSESRFDGELKRVGLVADAPHVRSALGLELRDPGVDMASGARPARRRGEQPLTRLVAQATRGQSGVDVGSDRDYRGVPVVGAWTWLPEYGFGVVTQVDRAEAFRPLAILQAAFWSLLALLAAAGIALCVFNALAARPRGRVPTAGLVADRFASLPVDAASDSPKCGPSSLQSRRPAWCRPG
jgi:eukaryotic-like serine/threonine-protein kinase